MREWTNYNKKPCEDNLQDYPTIVDVLEDIIDYEENHLKLTKFPLTKYRDNFYEIEEPGHYCVMHHKGNYKMAVLYPTGRNLMTFYRGESKYHETCIPSLLRTKDEQEILKAHLQTAELECILSQHPVIRDFLLREIHHTKLSQPFMLTVPFGGLAQHYEILSPYLDLTNDKWVACFFAITNYNNGQWDVVIPSEKQRCGSIYRIANVDFSDDAVLQPDPLGLQYFNRPGRQSAFTLDMTDMIDFNKYPGVERIFFRHDTEANRLIFDLCQQGRKFLPPDSLVGLVKQLKKVSKFSKHAVEMTRAKHYPSKNWQDMQAFIKEFGLEVSDSPLVNFSHQQLQKEWEDWQREGAERFLTKLIVTPVMTLTI